MNNDNIYGKWRYIFKRTRMRFVIVFILSIIILVLILLGLGNEKFWNNASIIVAFLTLGVTLFVSYEQIREEWAKSYLPKKFTGSFYYDGKEIMYFENALLTHEGDIRNLAQQIGLQMANFRLPESDYLNKLKFIATKIKVTGPTLNKKEKFIHYTISFTLTKRPKGIEENKKIVWRQTFKNGPLVEEIS